jgi:predicted kinase
MIAIGGLSGSGKTTLAQALGRHFDNTVVLDSDVLRKQMHGVDPLTPLPLHLYTPENTEAFIQFARKEAAKQLKDGKNVIVTGTFLDHATRRDQRLVAEQCGAEFIGLYLDVPVSKLFQRVAQRRDNPSDACVRILRRQLKNAAAKPTRKAGWHILRADGRLQKTVSTALCVIRTGDCPQQHKPPYKHPHGRKKMK